MIQIGFCGGPERMAETAAAGFDYLELPLCQIAGLSDAEFEKTRAALQNAPIPTPSFNVCLPGTIALFGGENPEAELETYLEGAFARARLLGGRVVVFGSGRSRTRPEGMAYGDAFRQLIRETRLMGKIAEKNGLTIAIEPLNREETNMINSIAEGAALAAAVDHPNVKLLADYYHIAKDGEPAEDIARVSGIAHAHIATLEGRRVPTEELDGFRRMFSAMRRTGYRGLISVEGHSDDLAKDGPVSVRMLKNLYESCAD